MSAELLRKKPACVLRRDAWLTELRQLEDRESLRPWLQRYGCFEKKDEWSSSGVVDLDNLKELAKKFRLHKSIPNFFRDYTSEDSLVAVLKRYVRNNASFLSLAPSSVARARPSGGGQSQNDPARGTIGAGGGGGGTCGGSGDGLHATGNTSPNDNASLLDGGQSLGSAGMTSGMNDDASIKQPTKTTTSRDSDPHHPQRHSKTEIFTGILSTDAHGGDGAGGGSSGQLSKISGQISTTAPHVTGNLQGRRISEGSAPRRPLLPKRPTKASILLNPNNGGRKLFGHTDADLTAGMIKMSRVDLSGRTVDRLQIICNNSKRPSSSTGACCNVTADSGLKGGVGVGGGPGASGATSGREDRHVAAGALAGITRQAIQTAPGGSGSGSGLAKYGKSAPGGIAMTDDGGGGEGTEDIRGAVGRGDGGEGTENQDGGTGDNDYNQTLRIKAAQALFRMSLETGGEAKLVRDGMVIALMKLMDVESVPAHRLVSGCLVNLTTTTEVTWALVQAKGHQVLALLVNGAKTRDPITLSNVATALCRCTYEARNHISLVTEFNAAQALCYIMQRQTANLKIIGAKGMLNMCGLSSNLPALAAKLDVYMLSLCSAMMDLARNEAEAVQTFVCRGIQGLTSVPTCLSRIPDSGVVDLLLPLVKLNSQRPGNLAYLASAAVNLAGLKSAHAQLVKQKDIVAVLCHLSTHPKLVESCCVAAACLSRTRELETHLAPLAMALVEINLPNEASVDCVAFFLQNVSRSHPVSKSAVTSWLALEADSASPDGRLACLSAIEHLIRHQEDVDSPLLRAGLMGTLHAILDEPIATAAKASHQAEESAVALAGASPGPSSTAATSVPATTARTPGGFVTPPVGGLSGNSSATGLNGAERPSTPASRRYGASVAKRITPISQPQNKKNRENLMRSGPDVLDRILAVVTKTCFSLTLRGKNRPRLVQHGLPALCGKVLKLTKDDNIKFMAAACIFSLAQSVDLCSDIAESGAADLALEDLAKGGRPGQTDQKESEYLLAQLAVVAQVAVVPRLCRRLASPKTIDLLMNLSLQGPLPKREDKSHPRASTEDTNHANRGVGRGVGSELPNGSRQDGGEGSGGASDRDHGDGGDGAVSGDSSPLQQQRRQQQHAYGPGMPLKFPRLTEEKVGITTPYLSCLRFCVVAIVERVAATLNNGEFEPSPSPSEITSMVVKLVYLVCSVVLASGPDEALMRRCARVMADWSSVAKFAEEMLVTKATGKSLSMLMRSVSPQTKNYASVALCNVAAASHCEIEPCCANKDRRAPPSAITDTREKAAVSAGGGGAQGNDTAKDDRQRQSDNYSRSGNIGKRSPNSGEPDGNDVKIQSNHRSSNNSERSEKNDESDGNDVQNYVSRIDCDEGSEAASDGDQYWLMTTDFLRDIIAGCVASATADVKSNLIKAMNNLMVSDERRAVLVTGNDMPGLFELVHGYTPEVRELVAKMLWNLTCEHGFHPALLEAGVTYTLLELLGCPSVKSMKEKKQQQDQNNAVSAVRGASNGNDSGSSAATASMPGSSQSSEAAPVDGGGSGGLVSVAGGEIAPDGRNSDAGPTTSGGGVVRVGSGPEATITSGGGHTADAVGNGPKSGSSNTGGGALGVAMVAAEAASVDHKPSLEVRRNVLGAVMNLTRSSVSDSRLDPSAVMSLLTLIMHEDPCKSPNEDMVADLWVTWQAVILQLSFVEKYRPLIVHHGDGQVFSHLKLTNDPLSGKSSVMSIAHDRAYKRLVMGTMVNISCEPSLFEYLEGQVQVLREFLSEYEHEASGGGHGAGGIIGGSMGARDDIGDGDGFDSDIEDKGLDEGVAGDGMGGGGGGSGGGNASDSPSRGRDWVRHELCTMLVSNLFSSKTLRERLSKKPIAGILVGLLCGPPRGNNGVTDSEGSGSNSNTRVPTTRPNKPGGTDNSSPTSMRGPSASWEHQGNNAKHHHHRKGIKHDGELPPPRHPPPEGCGEPRPLLYGGGDDVAAIASRFVCEMCILYSAEGGFDLPQRTFEALVKIAHYYNYNASEITAAAASSAPSNPWKAAVTGSESGSGVGGGAIGGQESCGKAAVAGSTSASLEEEQTSDSDSNASSEAAGNDCKDHASSAMAETDTTRTDRPADPSISPSAAIAGGAVDYEEKQRASMTSSLSSGKVQKPELSLTEMTAPCAPAAADAAATAATAATAAAGEAREGEARAAVTEGGGSGGDNHLDTTQQTKRSTMAQQQPVGDDWHTEGRRRTNGLAHRNRSNKLVGGRVNEDAWMMTAWEITRLWVRAVGSLCSPSHSNLWTQMIDVGMFGAINRCVSSPALSGDEEGLAICSAALKNLSTATGPQSLCGERAAACFGAAKRLLSSCSNQPQVQVDCAAAMVNFVDATHEQDLQTLDVVGLLGDRCSWAKHRNKRPSSAVVGELAIYSLSKLCTRNFVPKGDHVIATITTMMDFDPQTTKRLDDSVKSLVNPPLPPRGPWKFFHTTDTLGLTALPVLAKRANQERKRAVDEKRSGMAGEGQQRWSGDAVSSAAGGEGGRGLGTGSGSGDPMLFGGDVRWELQLAVRKKEDSEAISLSNGGEEVDLAQDPAKDTSETMNDTLNGQHQGQQPDGTSSSLKGTSTIGGGNVGEEIAEARKATSGTRNKTSCGGGGASGLEREAVTLLPGANLLEGGTKLAAGGGGGGSGSGSGGAAADGNDHKQAMRAFASTGDGSVCVEARILRNPILSREDPPFELPWLLRHGKAERLKLLEESLDGVPGSSSSIRRTDSSNPKRSSPSDVGNNGNNNNGGGGSRGQRQDDNQATPAATAAGELPHQQQQGVVGDGASGTGEEATAEAAADAEEYENGFEILTVPDGKWISPDLPPEAGKQHDTPHAVVNHGEGGGGGLPNCRPTFIVPRGPHVNGRQAGSNLATAPQQQSTLMPRASQRPRT